MKKIHSYVDDMAAKVDARWRMLPLKKQRRYTLLFSLGYLLLSIVIITDAWYGGPNEKSVNIEHIENPVLKEKKKPDKKENAQGTAIEEKIQQ